MSRHEGWEKNGRYVAPASIGRASHERAPVFIENYPQLGDIN
jgi:hypothetical protein